MRSHLTPHSLRISLSSSFRACRQHHKTRIRYSSTTTTPPFPPTSTPPNNAASTLLNRTYPPIHDHLSPINSHLLKTALIPLFDDPLPAYPTNISAQTPEPLNPAFHLVYFPPIIPESDLLPDGSDGTQSPGRDWVRRMWAGGSLKFDYSEKAGDGLMLGRRAVMEESVDGVKTKGEGLDEKMFVEFTRRHTGFDAEGRRFESPAVVERRDLVFFKSVAKGGSNARVVQAPRPPDYVYSFTPSTHLLFRFSALSFNAHKIHFDPIYTAREGHPAPLVHGPLSLVMIIEAARRHAAKSNRRIMGIEYRNLKPVHVGKEIRVCGRVKEGESVEGEELEVWLEVEGGLAVRGTVATA